MTVIETNVYRMFDGNLILSPMSLMEEGDLFVRVQEGLMLARATSNPYKYLTDSPAAYVWAIEAELIGDSNGISD